MVYSRQVIWFSRKKKITKYEIEVVSNEEALVIKT